MCVITTKPTRVCVLVCCLSVSTVLTQTEYKFFFISFFPDNFQFNAFQLTHRRV
jgi:hypothetical protein